MATPRKGHSDQDLKAPELPRADAVSTEAAASGIREPQAKSPVQLYEECATAERDAAKVDLDPIKILFAKFLFFGQPMFDPAPVMNDDPVKDKEADLEIRTQLWQGRKYRDILEYLRLSANREDRLSFIAWWLKLENVCEPEYILGPEELRKKARKKFYFLSESEFENAGRVSAWLPYFERLLRDLDDRSIAELVRLGYESTAVAASRGKRSAVEAACNWLALSDDGRVGALTLRNAYSKLYGPKRLRRRGYSLEKTTS